MLAMAAAVVDELPSHVPRYFMGMGTDSELLDLVALGVDMFDCVVPTRLARNATALIPEGHLSLRAAAAADDLRPIDERCDCIACARFSRAYLRHLFQAGEILAHRLVSAHNLAHVARVMQAARAAIHEGRLTALRAEVGSHRDGRPVSAAG
jgi:queuine tRNA-ribosyltransferase